MTEVELRPPREEEAAAVAALFSEYAPEPVAETVIRRAWSSPVFDREASARVAVERGRVTGYADVEDLGGLHTKFWAYVVGRPAARLLDWAEARALALAEGESRLFSGAREREEHVRAALERAGFRRVRHAYRMAIELDGEREPPAWPNAIAVRTFEPGDERAVYEAHQETFEDSWEHTRMPYDEWTHWMLERDDFDHTLWFLAEDGDRLAAIALCRPDEVRPGVGWVGILGVRRPWRRRGLARALLLHAFSEFGRRGFHTVVLGVDAESLTGAQRLYEAAGMRVVHRFDTYEKGLAA